MASSKKKPAKVKKTRKAKKPATKKKPAAKAAAKKAATKKKPVAKKKPAAKSAAKKSATKKKAAPKKKAPTKKKSLSAKRKRATTTKKKPAPKKKLATKKKPTTKKKPVAKATAKKAATKKKTAPKRKPTAKAATKKKPTTKKKPATKKKPVAKATVKKAASKKKSSAKKKPTPKKKPAAKKPAAKKTTVRRKPTAKATAKASGKSDTPGYVGKTARATTDIVRVRARFTEPLRRFSPYENLRDLIKGQAEKYGDQTFLVFEDDGREYSFNTLDEQTTKVANVLHELGSAKGARVALLLENCPDFVFSFLGIMKGGFIAVPMNLELADEQLRFLLEDCGANTVITSASVFNRIAPLMNGLPGLENVLVAGKTEDLVGVTVQPNHTLGPADEPREYGLLDLTGCLDAAPGDHLKTSDIGWWDEAQIVYTGHHLDQPRGAILQHRQFMTSARWLAIWLNLNDSQRFMSVLPLFHANAQIVTLFTPLQIGGSVVLSRVFSVSRVWKAVERYRVTSLSAVPSMLGILTSRELSEAGAVRSNANAPWPASHESPGTLAQREDTDARDRGLGRAHDISSLERVLCGAAPLPTAVQKQFEKTFLVPVIEGYSMAETTCFAMLNPGNGTRKLGSVGVAVGNKAAIQSNDIPPRALIDDWQPTSLARMNPAVFATANIGEPGEICVWGENVLKEYFHRPKINPEAFASGWFHTGDIGLQDHEGFFYVQGPKDFEIQKDGKRFMPREVDESLFEHAEVERAATVGLDDSNSGSMVTTYVVMRKGTFEGGKNDGRLPMDDSQLQKKRAELRMFLSKRLTETKRPTTIVFAPNLPSDTTGKTRVLELKRLAARHAQTAEEE